MEAVRNIPYGIQQPAVSAQILQLEDALGVTLFHRRPFALTPPGQKLYDFIKPFFSNLDALERDISGGTTKQIRIGASEVVLRDHLPAVLENVRKKFPDLKIVLREGYQPALEKLLQENEIDVAVTLLENKPPPGICSFTLLKLPLVLLVHKKSKITSAAELWKRDKIQETLLCLPPSEAICRNFQAGLARLGVDWFPGIELSSVDVIQAYVENGYGVGLSVEMPKPKLLPNVRVVPLDGFDPVIFGILWQGKPNELLNSFIHAVKQRVASLDSSAKA